jgi:hypothetical protein
MLTTNYRGVVVIETPSYAMFANCKRKVKGF